MISQNLIYDIKNADFIVKRRLILNILSILFRRQGLTSSGVIDQEGKRCMNLYNAVEECVLSYRTDMHE